MSTFANQLKAEISRLARKEARAEVSALKKLTSQYRSEIATLKKRVSEIETVLKKLEKASLRSNSKAISDAPEKALRFRVAGFATLRKKLGLSAAEMGQLIGVSAQSIYHWESGKTKPRASQLTAISSVRKLGKKEVASRLANSPSN